MKYIKNGFIILLAAVFGIAGQQTAFAQGNGKKVQPVFEGELKKPVHVADFSGDEFFSVRDIAQAYGSRVVYHPVTGKVAMQMNNRRLDIYIKSTRVFIDGKKRHLSVPSRLISGELFVPASFFLSDDFANFSDTLSQYNPDSGILTVERKININPPRFYSNPDLTQIVIELNENLPYNYSRKKPGVLSLTFNRGRLNEEKTAVNDGIVAGYEARNTGRRADINIFLAPGAGTVDNKYDDSSKKLVVTVRGDGVETRPDGPVVSAGVAISTGAAVETNVSTAARAQAGQAEVSTSPAGGFMPAVVSGAAPAPAAAPALRKKNLIILDAGHGGDDPGAVGPNGTKEKDINLAIVYELKRLFEEDGEYNVLLSRSDDTFIPLVERTSFANDKRADMFVSVHCNAGMNRDSSGFEIYFLSENASDSDAAATAVLENSVVRLEGKPNKKRAKLQELLWSMTVNEFINESSELCSIIGSEVTRRIKIENRGVKQAGFFVLRGAMMPAVLVESAFLSNYGEEAKLRSRKFQANIADSIFEGIKKYDLRRGSVNAKK